jgi:hypothetical protein
VTSLSAAAGEIQVFQTVFDEFDTILRLSVGPLCRFISRGTTYFLNDQGQIPTPFLGLDEALYSWVSRHIAAGGRIYSGHDRGYLARRVQVRSKGVRLSRRDRRLSFLSPPEKRRMQVFSGAWRCINSENSLGLTGRSRLLRIFRISR